MFTARRDRKRSLAEFPPFHGLVNAVGVVDDSYSSTTHMGYKVHWFTAVPYPGSDHEFYVAHNGHLTVLVGDYVIVEFDHQGKVTSIVVTANRSCHS